MQTAPVTAVPFSHSYEQKFAVDAEFARRLVKEGLCSVGLNRAGLDAPLVVLPLDLQLLLCKQDAIITK